MTLVRLADTSALRWYTPRGVAVLAAAGLAAASLVAMPLSARADPATSATPRVAAVHAAAAGKLPLQGCTESGATATCDLYAMTGTASVLGQPIPIWGFSSTGAADSASAPGPVLVVNQGDAVTVTLHNQLTEPVSLVFPGQPADAFSVGLSAQAEETGAAPGASQKYTFTAARAGTFLYEAGHTADGTRQVAMGLAGALVVRPADGSAYGVQGVGYPSTAYHDDAVLVLSEIDPALNASPATFDMRNFQPTYRLINGKPFPATDPISTDQGHKVLLRYVNIGSQPHSMGLLGANQTQVGQDGHALRYAETAVVMPLSPGATADTIVTMPTGPESKIALYEAAGHLDNNGQTTDDPLSFAFGGMLTYLDTAAPPPSIDIVGPVSSNIAVSPNPSDGLSDATVTADLSDATTGGSLVTQAEFVIDDAVIGVGFSTPLTGAFGSVSVAGATGTISQAVLDGLDAGTHTVFVRALDGAGNWGVIGGVVFNLPKTGPQTTNGTVSPNPANGTVDVAISATGDDSAAGGTITDAEYFFDTVGADGAGTALTANRVAMIVSVDGVISAATVRALGEGLHHVFVHTKDSLRLWGPPLDISLIVDLTGPGVEAASVGPNPSNGVLTDPAHPGYLVVSARITDRDTGGALQSVLTDAEAFLDPRVAIPAGGTGVQMIAVDGAMDGQTETVYGLIPISQVRSLTSGTHHVFVRGLDAAGNWGTLFGVDLIVDKAAPVLSPVVGAPNPTNGAANLTLTAPVNEVSFAAAEFWLGTTDPGAGRATRVPVSLVGTSIVATVPLAGIPAGAQRFNLRVQDLAGNWSNAVNTTVTVTLPNAIFANAFDSGNLAGWSASTGFVSVTAAAGIPTGGGNVGLQVSLPGGRTNAASYLTATWLTAETGYHASFGFNANTLTSGTNANTVLTIFEARTTTGGQVFAVQFHRTAAGVNQIRTVMSRSNAAALTGAWSTLPTGAHTIRVDWVSGPATGANAGSLRLQRDGATISTQSGNTSTLRIAAARLGVTAGVTSTATSTMAGTAYIDSFVSTRYTLP